MPQEQEQNNLTKDDQTEHTSITQSTYHILEKFGEEGCPSILGRKGKKGNFK